jgi:hypothetical protein
MSARKTGLRLLFIFEGPFAPCGFDHLMDTHVVRGLVSGDTNETHRGASAVEPAHDEREIRGSQERMRRKERALD